jgi:serine protease AprX
MLHASVTRRSPARRAVAALALCAAVSGAGSAAAAKPPGAHLPGPLRAAAARDGAREFDVIVQGQPGSRSETVAAAVENETAARERRRFTMISGVAARMNGRQLLHLAQAPGILAITVDAPVRARDLVPPTVLGPPTISGVAVEGSVLTASPGSWSGAEPISYGYAWQTCAADGSCADIPGASEATMLLAPGTAGTAVRVVVTATDATGASASAPSDVVAVEAAAAPEPPAPEPAPVPPSALAEPGIAGSGEVGVELAASNGDWTGDAPISLSYRWQRCDAAGNSCAEVAGATGAAYTPVWEDVRSTLRVAVTATNAAGAATATSAPTGVITPLRRAGRWNWQLWPYAAGVPDLWDSAAPSAVPAIAVVDSGVDPSVPDLEGRVSRQVTLTSLPDNAAGDGRGHGTFVASLAAGAAQGRTGAAPTAQIVSLDVLDDHGMGTTSDVLAAADWIYTHRVSDGIRVANFSLTGSVGTSFEIDPLDRAIERLWLSGVVVVTAAGNYGSDAGPSGVPYAPSNDPLAITVGATDVAGTAASDDDFAARWSSYGYTMDGFAKPELVAPGRSIIGPVPAGATLALEHPERVVAPGLMQLSGTSLAAPIVAGAAANLLAVHPDWTPDDVKGALMQTATPLSGSPTGAAGVGEINAAAAARVQPTNPNGAVRHFVVPDPNGGPTPVIDTSAWAAAAAAAQAWATTYWGSTYWGSTYWGSTYWGSTYWGSTTAGATYWGSTYWGSTYWGSTYWGSNVDDDSEPAGASGAAEPAPPPISPDAVE